MIFKQGIHLYINIKNLDDLVIIDSKDDDLKHIIHEMNTFFTTIEIYAKDKFQDDVFIEKVTGSRLHLIIFDEKQVDIMVKICRFAYLLSKEIGKFAKYSALDSMKLQFGADYGDFTDCVIKVDDYEEYTSIGYPANYAAKLQSVSKRGYLYISEKIYNKIDSDEQDYFSLLDENEVEEIKKKYGSSFIYKFDLKGFENSLIFNAKTINGMESYVDRARELSNSTHYNQMDNIQPRTSFSFDDWNLKKIAKFRGIIVFADIRGFTKKFKSDGSNLPELSKLTSCILEDMYQKCKENFGVHVQFQGDREYALFPNERYKEACWFALKLVDQVKKYDVHIGVGVSSGIIHGTKMGIRGSKDNILLGYPVILADRLEDDYADKDCIAISEDVYFGLGDEHLQKLFEFKGKMIGFNKKWYLSRNGYKDYCFKKQYDEAQRKPSQEYTRPYMKKSFINE